MGLGICGSRPRPPAIYSPCSFHVCAERMNFGEGEVTQAILTDPPKVLVASAEALSASPSSCVICLDIVSERAVVLPCHHDNFDFACLGAWLQRRAVCPLCKAAATGIQYDLEAAEGPQTFGVPLEHPHPDVQDSQPGPSRQGLRGSARSSRRLNEAGGRRPGFDKAVERRRLVYRHGMYSLHVGSNRFSRYRTLTPGLFLKDEALARRAKVWVRRELQVFDFLRTDTSTAGRRALNNEFLAEYILAILRSVDIRGSTGQAEDLLQEFLGRVNARLFLHELESWLRSPFETVEEWDNAVQYPI